MIIFFFHSSENICSMLHIVTVSFLPLSWRYGLSWCQVLCCIFDTPPYWSRTSGQTQCSGSTPWMALLGALEYLRLRTLWAWYSRIDSYLQDLGFEKSEADPNLYYLVDGEDHIILVLYVDDLFITGEERLIQRCKLGLASKFKMKDIGLMHYFWAWRYGRMMGTFFWGKGSMLPTSWGDFKWRGVDPCRLPWPPTSGS